MESRVNFIFAFDSGPFSKMIQTYVDMQKREQIEKHQLSQQQEKDMYELSKKVTIIIIYNYLQYLYSAL